LVFLPVVTGDFKATDCSIKPLIGDNNPTVLLRLKAIVQSVVTPLKTDAVHGFDESFHCYSVVHLLLYAKAVVVAVKNQTQNCARRMDCGSFVITEGSVSR
jgi:2-methylisocitrate lyase-like PEP mutase family enzyme